MSSANKIIAYKKNPKGGYVLVANLSSFDEDSRKAIRCYIAKSEMFFCSLGKPLFGPITDQTNVYNIETHFGAIDFTNENYVVMYFDFKDIESAAFLMEMIVKNTADLVIPEDLEIDDPMTVLVTSGIWEMRDSELKKNIVALIQSSYNYGIIESDKELCKNILEIIQ